MTKTPIALFVYNRPQHTHRMLETLSRCARLEECRPYIFCDGAKREEHAADVEAARAVVREWAGQAGAEVVERTENRGLARSIVSGVGELCEEYGRVIVVEDDLVLSPSFLDYMLQSLERYAGEPQVYQISGYMFPVEHPPQPDAFFMPLTTTWGWATWRRAWRIFDWEPNGARAMLADANVRRRFDLDGSYPYSAMLEQRLEGLNDSWGILWWWAVFKAGGLVLHPRRSLVWNGGFDGSGTHCGNTTDAPPEIPADFAPARLPRSLALPDRVETDDAALLRIVKFMRGQQQAPPQRSLKGNLQRAVGRMLRVRRL
jgi:hypothetical protein